MLSTLSAARPRLAIMLFHRVLAAPDPMRPFEPDADTFERQMRWVRSVFQILPLSEAVTRLRDRSLPTRAIAVTFDDGYLDNLTIALPVLQKLDIPFSVFVATGFSDGAMMWNDAVIEAVRALPEGPLDLRELGLGEIAIEPRGKPAAAARLLSALKYRETAERTEIATKLLARAAIPPPRLMMNAAELRQLSDAGAELGGHTLTHPILCNLDEAEAAREIVANRQQLERISGRAPGIFAYPNGRPNTDYGRREIRLLREAGYEAAVSTAWGAAGSDDDVFQLPRFTPWDRGRTKYLLRLTANYGRGPRTLAA